MVLLKQTKSDRRGYYTYLSSQASGLGSRCPCFSIEGMSFPLASLNGACPERIIYVNPDRKDVCFICIF